MAKAAKTPTPAMVIITNQTKFPDKI